MRRRFLIPALVALLAVGWAAPSEAERTIEDGLEVTFSADLTPKTLPRERPAPVTVAVHGSIATTDGSHPPPLRWLEIKLNRNGRLYSRGLPVCAAPTLQSTSSQTALARCGGAKVGQGSFQAEVTLGRPIQVAGKILAFNSRRKGKQALLLHLFAGAPVRFTLVVPLTVGHLREGQFGSVLRARVPRLGGDLGSVTAIDLKIGRRYDFAGQRRSFLTAACSAPQGFTEVPFVLSRGIFRFESHQEVTIPVERFCRVR